MDETKVKCGIDNCDKVFPERLKEAHLNEAHLAGLKDKALSKMKVVKDESVKETKKVNLTASGSGQTLTVNTTAPSTTE